MNDDFSLVQVEVVETGKLIYLPEHAAAFWGGLGRVRLPQPKADDRYAPHRRLTLAETWQDGAFTPGRPVQW